MDKRLQFRVLGPLEVATGSGSLTLGSPRERTLLALLLLNPNRLVPRERLIDALWGQRPPATAANALQVAIHRLRKLLGTERVLTQGTGYQLAVEPGELDLDRFSELVERSRAEEAASAAETLREALSLWRGVALADLSGGAFVPAERERLEELRLAALERRIDADLECGAHAQLVGELEALIDEHPFREKLRGQLMLALYRSGRQAEALETYRRARTTLVDELGIEPSSVLQELEAAILRQDSSLEAPPPSERIPSSLPAPARPLIGREAELVAVTALVRSPGVRLVTLTGTGGTGKTRLALEAAHELLEDYKGRVFLVDLAPIRDPELVAPTLARVLEVRDTAGEALLDRIASAVGERETLLFVDNFEHVLEAATFVADVLARAPCLRVLATSREPLRVAAEHEYRVPTLALPPRKEASDVEVVSRTEATALFVARARAARPSFELDRSNAAVVVEICHALDGLPLALELAAARVKLLTPAQLLSRLEDRLDVLADGARDLPDRQRTLRATLDWSYELLDSGEQRLLARLAVFAAGWSLEAAEQACSADLSTLGSLVEKSLVRAEHDSAGEPRFSMLETVREYALERLMASGELDLICDRHARYFGDVAERLEPTIETAAAVEEVHREHDNIRQALEHALARRDGEGALRLCAIARFWYGRGYLTEGSAWIERALALEGGSPVRRARMLYVAATIAWSSGAHERAIERAHESLRLAREVDDEIAEVGALTALGLGQLGIRDLHASRDYHRLCLERARAFGRDRWIAIALTNIADLEVMLGNYGDADELAGESLEINRRIGDVEGTGVALLVLASSAIERGRGPDAVPMIVESIRCFRLVDFKDFLASSLVALARVRAPNDPTGAARLLGAARALRAPLGPAQFPWEQEWFDTTFERIRAGIGDVRAEEAVSEGASTPDEAIEEELARSS